MTDPETVFASTLGRMARHLAAVRGGTEREWIIELASRNGLAEIPGLVVRILEDGSIRRFEPACTIEERHGAATGDQT